MLCKIMWEAAKAILERNAQPQKPILKGKTRRVSLNQ